MPISECVIRRDKYRGMFPKAAIDIVSVHHGGPVHVEPVQTTDVDPNPSWTHPA